MPGPGRRARLLRLKENQEEGEAGPAASAGPFASIRSPAPLALDRRDKVGIAGVMAEEVGKKSRFNDEEDKALEGAREWSGDERLSPASWLRPYFCRIGFAGE